MMGEITNIQIVLTAAMIKAALNKLGVADTLQIAEHALGHDSLSEIQTAYANEHMENLFIYMDGDVLKAMFSLEYIFWKYPPDDYPDDAIACIQELRSEHS